MHDYFYVKEQLDVLNIEKKLLKLSENFKDKKVAIWGINSAFRIVSENFDLQKMFNVIGLLDFELPYQIDAIDDLTLLSPDNLYFSGIDLLINLNLDGAKTENYLRKHHIVKKKVKIVNLFEKTFEDKFFDFLNVSKLALSFYNKTGQIIPVIKEIFNGNFAFAESRINYLSKIFSLMENTEKPLRVIFVVFDYKKWFLSELYFKLRADKSFKILPILVLPDNFAENQDDSAAETIKYFKDNGYECLDGIEHDTNNAVMLEALKPDIIIYQQTDCLKSDYTPNCISKYALTCYVEPDFDYYKKTNIGELKSYRLNNTWKIYSFDNKVLNSFKNTVNSGFALFEKYNKRLKVQDENIWNNKDKLSVCKLIYSQSYFSNENFDKQQFIEYQNSMLEYAKAHKQYNFIFVPDKNLKRQCIENNILSDIEFESYINKWQELENAVVKDNISAIPFYNSSDIFMTDNINTCFEYFPLGKPVILLKNTQDVKFNDIGSKVFKTFYKLPTIEPLDIVLEDLMLAKNDYNSELRKSILEKYREYFCRETSDIIVNDLKMSLGRMPSAE